MVIIPCLYCNFNVQFNTWRNPIRQTSHCQAFCNTRTHNFQELAFYTLLLSNTFCKSPSVRPFRDLVVDTVCWIPFEKTPLNRPIAFVPHRICWFGPLKTTSHSCSDLLRPHRTQSSYGSGHNTCLALLNTTLRNLTTQALALPLPRLTLVQLVNTNDVFNNFRGFCVFFLKWRSKYRWEFAALMQELTQAVHISINRGYIKYFLKTIH